MPARQITANTWYKKTHTRVILGAKGDDLYKFNVPAGQEVDSVELDVVGGRYDAGARLEQAPASGATGADKRIKVQ